MSNGFDVWLERELTQAASAQSGPHPLPSQARYKAASLQPSSLMNFVLVVRSLASNKAAAAAAVAVLAVVAVGGVAEAAITGSADPSNWGHQVVRQVQKCQAALAPGSHGIGECVSSFASQHGKSGTNAANDDPKHTPAPPTNRPGNPGAGNSSSGNPSAGNSSSGNPSAGNSSSANPGAGNSSSRNHRGGNAGHKPDKLPPATADKS